MVKGVILIVFGALAILSAKALGGHTYELYQQGQASEDWQAIEAKVTRFQAEGSTRLKGRQRPENPHFEVTYHYAVDGIEYTGERLGFGPYEKGQLVRPEHGLATVYYDPDNPAESVYLRGVSQPNLYALALSVGLAVFGALLGVWGLWKIYRKLR